MKRDWATIKSVLIDRSTAFESSTALFAAPEWVNSFESFRFAAFIFLFRRTLTIRSNRSWYDRFRRSDMLSIMWVVSSASHLVPMACRLFATNNITNSALIFSSNTDISPNMRNGKNSIIRSRIWLKLGSSYKEWILRHLHLFKNTHDPRLFQSNGRCFEWRSVSSEIQERHCLLLVFRRRYVFVHSHRILHDRHTHIFEHRCV